MAKKKSPPTLPSPPNRPLSEETYIVIAGRGRIVGAFKGLMGLLEAQQLMRRQRAGVVRCIRQSDGKLLSSRTHYVPKESKKPHVDTEVDDDSPLPVDNDD